MPSSDGRIITWSIRGIHSSYVRFPGFPHQFICWSVPPVETMLTGAWKAVRLLEKTCLCFREIILMFLGKAVRISGKRSGRNGETIRTKRGNGRFASLIAGALGHSPVPVPLCFQIAESKKCICHYTGMFLHCCEFRALLLPLSGISSDLRPVNHLINSHFPIVWEEPTMYLYR